MQKPERDSSMVAAALAVHRQADASPSPMHRLCRHDDRLACDAAELNAYTVSVLAIDRTARTGREVI